MMRMRTKRRKKLPHVAPPRERERERDHNIIWLSHFGIPRWFSLLRDVPSAAPFHLPLVCSSSSACFPAAARRSCKSTWGKSVKDTGSKSAMGCSPSVMARASDPPASGFDEGAVVALGKVQVLAASNGMPVFFKDLWDQEQGMAVVALLRHFGCICWCASCTQIYCSTFSLFHLAQVLSYIIFSLHALLSSWALASELKELIPRLEAAGVKLIAVGVGSPENARILAERLPFPSDYLYADPDRKVSSYLSLLGLPSLMLLFIYYELNFAGIQCLGLYYGLRHTFFNPASTKVFSRFGSLRKAAQNYTISATPDDKSSVLQQVGMLIFKGKDLLYARKDEGTGDHAPMSEVLDICCNVPVA